MAGACRFHPCDRVCRDRGRLAEPAAGPHLARMSDPPVTVLDHELREEMASALGRAGRRLEAALRRLDDSSEVDRPAHVAEARDALWCLLVQRDAVGLRDGAALLVAHYGIPADVHAGVVVERPRHPRLMR